MIEPRVYRAAFLPAVLALVLTAFSLGNRPGPVPQGLAADVLFEGRLAAGTVREIVRDLPERTPGSPGDQALAELVGTRLANEGFKATKEPFEEDGRALVNVVGRRAGASRRQIVVMAARDSASAPDATGSAADTAALLELGRVIAGRSSRKTIVLVSTAGGSVGDAGARRYLRTAGDRSEIDAVVILSNLAAPRARGSMLIQWSTDAKRGGIGLLRTAQASLRQELGRIPGEEGALAQMARLAAPVGIGAQAELIAEGFDAIRISASGELPPEGGERDPEDLDVERYGQVGRGALRLVSALDGQAHPDHGPESYVMASRKVLPGWALSLLAITLLFPPLAAAVDAFARLRRRREPVAPWLVWVGLLAVPWLAALLAAELIVLIGQAPDAPPAPLPPSAEELDTAAGSVLGITAAVVLVGYVLVRLMRGRAGVGDSPGAGGAVALALCVVAVAVWIVNPYTALLLVPAVHVWTLAVLGDTHLRRATGILLIALGLLAPTLVAVYYLDAFDLDPLTGLWYLFLLVTGHAIGLPTALIGCALLGITAAVIAVLLGRLRTPPAPPPTEGRPSVRGPAGYAGPGSLGGTESALPPR